MSTYSLSNFALVEKQFILIYDINGYLRYSINPLEAQFFTRNKDCVIENNGNGTDKYIILDFSSSDEATQATTRLQNLKSSMTYYVEWSNLTGIPSSLSGFGITDSYTKEEVDAKFTTGATSESVGVTINGKYVAGVKNYIRTGETLYIPEDYEYNVFKFTNDGTINLDGEINIM